MNNTLVIQNEGWIPSMFEWFGAIIVLSIIFFWLIQTAFRFARQQRYIKTIGVINNVFLVFFIILLVKAMVSHAVYAMPIMAFYLRCFLWAVPLVMFLQINSTLWRYKNKR